MGELISAANNLPATKFAFAGKTVLITGGAQGIGRCLSQSFAACDARVIIFDINEQAALETVNLIEQAGKGSVIYINVDLADEKSINLAVEQILPVLDESGLDVLINNAAIADAHNSHLYSSDISGFDRVIAINLRAPFVMSKILACWLIKAKGNIINIASTRAFMSEPETEGYSSSKGGIVSLTHSMAMTLGGNNVRVNCISPGWIATDSWQQGSPDPIEYSKEDHTQHPAGRIGVPADIAAACLFLASEDAGFITGVNLTVDGGMTHKMIYK